jgi:uncharacterized membrane protein (UPF0127 family)
VLRLAAAALAAAGGVTFPHADAVIATGHRSVALRVEVASTDAQRAEGLMNRRRLSPKAGMVFLFAQPTRTQFWMKDTLIPLSIAFWGPDGRIYKMFEMQPCTADPCHVYEPGGTFVGAIEMGQGEFDRLGVKIGDTVEVKVNDG